MTAHHTPGKWKKEKYRIFANSFAKPEYPIHAEKRGLIAKAFRESDAYLIAASPDLLEALKDCLSELQRCAQQLESEGWKTGSSVTKALEAARIAITKAEGKE